MSKLHPAFDQEWFVIIDDTVGGKAIGNADKPLSQYKPEQGEIIVAHWINESFAGHMVMLHNVWLAERREIAELGDKSFHTYRLASGDLIAGEYSFMCEDDTWTSGELDEPEDVVHEVWECVHRETITFKPAWWDESRAEDEVDTVDLAGGGDIAGDLHHSDVCSGLGDL